MMRFSRNSSQIIRKLCQKNADQTFSPFLFVNKITLILPGTIIPPLQITGERFPVTKKQLSAALRSAAKSCLQFVQINLRNVSLYEVQKSAASCCILNTRRYLCIHCLEITFLISLSFCLSATEWIGTFLGTSSECFALPEALLTYRAGFLTCRSPPDFSLLAQSDKQWVR